MHANVWNGLFLTSSNTAEKSRIQKSDDDDMYVYFAVAALIYLVPFVCIHQSVKTWKLFNLIIGLQRERREQMFMRSGYHQNSC